MSEIEAALTAEEWKAVKECIYGDDPHIVMPDGSFKYLDYQEMAAVCLDGQPFGFTWEDVDRLMKAIIPEYWNYGGPEIDESATGMLYDLADRIAALLPPRKGG